MKNERLFFHLDFSNDARSLKRVSIILKRRASKVKFSLKNDAKNDASSQKN